MYGKSECSFFYRKSLTSVVLLVKWVLCYQMANSICTTNYRKRVFLFISLLQCRPHSLCSLSISSSARVHFAWTICYNKNYLWAFFRWKLSLKLENSKNSEACFELRVRNAINLSWKLNQIEKWPHYLLSKKAECSQMRKHTRCRALIYTHVR